MLPNINIFSGNNIVNNNNRARPKTKKDDKNNM